MIEALIERLSESELITNNCVRVNYKERITAITTTTTTSMFIR